MSHLDHRYTTVASKSVIKSPQVPSTRATHSSQSQVGMRSQGWIQMHLSINFSEYSSPISSNTDITPVSRPQIVENIFIASKLFVSVACRSTAMRRSQMVTVLTFFEKSRSKRLPTHMFYHLQESKVQQNSHGVEDRGKKIGRVLRGYSL